MGTEHHLGKLLRRHPWAGNIALRRSATRGNDDDGGKTRDAKLLGNALILGAHFRVDFDANKIAQRVCNFRADQHILGQRLATAAPIGVKEQNHRLISARLCRHRLLKTVAASLPVSQTDIVRGAGQGEQG